MRKDPFALKSISRPKVDKESWNDWKWQYRNRLKSLEDFQGYFSISKEEVLAFEAGKDIFRVQTTPYYAALSAEFNPDQSIRKILIPHQLELGSSTQQMPDPLGELKNSPTPRVVHRYPDRALLLVTDLCSVYCRYCTRKYFTASDQAMISSSDLERAVNYFKSQPQIREVILSGGDPLTLGNQQLDKILSKLREVSSIEIIRIGSRMPVVSPMRIDQELAQILQNHAPVYMMHHFNHPDEITQQSAQAMELLVNHGIPSMNQMVLLNGVNNDPALIQALSRRLLYYRVKPYYMFQCDPSMGTDHLRTQVEDSLEIQKQLWGRLSGLAMPTLSLDIPQGGGKATLVPNFLQNQKDDQFNFKGWDGVEGTYINPKKVLKPHVEDKYQQEWSLYEESN